MGSLFSFSERRDFSSGISAVAIYSSRLLFGVLSFRHCLIPEQDIRSIFPLGMHSCPSHASIKSSLLQGIFDATVPVQLETFKRIKTNSIKHNY
ncbi:hypothetical protein CEXT_588331 [Caerostris extrusa]|uniref:Uncharacterized protein n=1 Tax=Caerostris extrusa TaxID=172846 RepID=A0AAV4NNU2_CAEEX|nr:hypothetical protein CEXT_588331 [Caerostris extrusa]